MEAQQELLGPSTAAQGLFLACMAATEDIDPLNTESQELLVQPAVTCYVCNQPGSTDRLITCMSGPVYRRLTAGSNLQAVDPAFVASDSLLQQLLQPGKPGTVARQIEGAKHCQRHFHQSCLGRRKEAVFDNRMTIVKQLKDGSQETRVKDLRHRLCGECLQLEQGSQETQYTGALDGVCDLATCLCAWQAMIDLCIL